MAIGGGFGPRRHFRIGSSPVYQAHSPNACAPEDKRKRSSEPRSDILVHTLGFQGAGVDLVNSGHAGGWSCQLLAVCLAFSSLLDKLEVVLGLGGGIQWRLPLGSAGSSDEAAQNEARTHGHFPLRASPEWSNLKKSIEYLAAAAIQSRQVADQELHSVAVGNQKRVRCQTADIFLATQDERGIAAIGFHLPG